MGRGPGLTFPRYPLSFRRKDLETLLSGRSFLSFFLFADRVKSPCRRVAATGLRAGQGNKNRSPPFSGEAANTVAGDGLVRGETNAARAQKVRGSPKRLPRTPIVAVVAHPEFNAANSPTSNATAVESETQRASPSLPKERDKRRHVAVAQRPTRPSEQATPSRSFRTHPANSLPPSPSPRARRGTRPGKRPPPNANDALAINQPSSLNHRTERNGRRAADDREPVLASCPSCQRRWTMGRDFTLQIAKTNKPSRSEK